MFITALAISSQTTLLVVFHRHGEGTNRRPTVLYQVDTLRVSSRHTARATPENSRLDDNSISLSPPPASFSATANFMVEVVREMSR